MRNQESMVQLGGYMLPEKPWKMEGAEIQRKEGGKKVLKGW
jgi:hypothetical protein